MGFLFQEAGRFPVDAYGACDIAHTALDRMYGTTSFTRFANRLRLSKEVQRQKFISHLGLLDGMAPYNASASRYEHICGVAWLIFIATAHPSLRPYRDVLLAAAFGHDIGSPPYTHSTEPAMRKVIGYDHETLIRARLLNGEWARIARQANLLEDALQVIEGRHPLRFLTYLLEAADTLEGICRYSLMWRRLESGGLPYRPDTIAHYFQVQDEQLVVQDREEVLCIPEQHLRRFTATRKEVFDHIHGPAIQGPQAMVERALHLAAEARALTDRFFFLSDEKATGYLCSRRVPTATRVLMRDVCMDRHYCRAFEWSSASLTPTQERLIAAPDSGQALADRLAEALAIPPSHACVHVTRHKGMKPLKGIAFLTCENEPMCTGFSSETPPWMVNAYLHPSHQERRGELETCLSSLLKA